jgi:hypothetical protein
VVVPDAVVGVVWLVAATKIGSEKGTSTTTEDGTSGSPSGLKELMTEVPIARGGVRSGFGSLSVANQRLEASYTVDKPPPVLPKVFAGRLVIL